MPSQFERTELLIGAEGIARLAKARIAVFGIGGRELCCGSSCKKRRRCLGSVR